MKVDKTLIIIILFFLITIILICFVFNKLRKDSDHSLSFKLLQKGNNTFIYNDSIDKKQIKDFMDTYDVIIK